ncbi:putative LLM family oxidoreductase [Rhodobacter aestuarii]|uniref:Probable oxidoreductase, LLM family n=1 Tax=Rhodobacter aestuarii TaxID=453582 RepID=A0A1N7PSX2_9RHOB|nr:LLM class flavin-dependent oxidoreductase [Rhodobacter aestuarii]PTV94192.1 putative LLM family oxidoreductase [Rhodobacter aestuarii]SIT13662.1 probable oxidoreductase, LLM family [Rhodobacter aestuarii]
MTLEFGLDTFGDITATQSGPQSAAQVIRDTLAEAVLADEVGLNYFGLGEHHRPDYAISSMEPLIATILAKTKTIHAGTSVTVLSSDDPIRLYQRFATLDALAPGRAEITIGRGSFTESFPLFGYELQDYETLFSEKAQLLHELLSREKISFRGHHRTSLQNVTVYPRPERPLSVWRGVGGSPDSVLEAAAMNMPLVMAIIGGNPARFASLADLYRKARAQMGGAELPLSVHSPGHIAKTDEEAKERFFPAYAKMHDLIGRSRGWPQFTRAAFEHEIANGSLYVGSPETVAQKIARTMGVLGLQRFTLKYSAGPQDPAHLRETVELYGTKVAPRVRELLAAAPANA